LQPVTIPFFCVIFIFPSACDVYFAWVIRKPAGQCGEFVSLITGDGVSWQGAGWPVRPTPFPPPTHILIHLTQTVLSDSRPMIFSTFPRENDGSQFRRPCRIGGLLDSSIWFTQPPCDLKYRRPTFRPTIQASILGRPRALDSYVADTTFLVPFFPFFSYGILAPLTTIAVAFLRRQFFPYTRSVFRLCLGFGR